MGCDINGIGRDMVLAYDAYRKRCDLLAQYIMAECCGGYTVYVVESDIDVFHIHFCAEADRKNDRTLIISKEQIPCISHILKDFLPSLC